jgi:mitochondrial translocator assembly and maintenance protein 41
MLYLLLPQSSLGFSTSRDLRHRLRLIFSLAASVHRALFITINMQQDDSDGQLQSSKALLDLVNDYFPREHIVHVFGYGSGVFAQESQSKEQKTVDLICVVDDSRAFHHANLQVNRQDYWIPLLVPSSKAADWATSVQRHEVDNAFFANPGISFHVTSHNLKYGIVQNEDIIRDLCDWKYLYLAGRMHKPILTVIDNDAIQAAQQANLRAAIACSLLLLSSSSSASDAVCTASPTQIYTKIASLSYTGDPRMTAHAEDPHKVDKLVQGPGQLVRWEALYKDAVQDLQKTGVLSCTGNQWEWTKSARNELTRQLPLRLQSVQDGRALQEALRATVSRSAKYQSMKGLLTAGPHKSWKYAMRKLSKGLLKR